MILVCHAFAATGTSLVLGLMTLEQPQKQVADLGGDRPITLGDAL